MYEENKTQENLDDTKDSIEVRADIIIIKDYFQNDPNRNIFKEDFDIIKIRPNILHES